MISGNNLAGIIGNSQFQICSQQANGDFRSQAHIRVDSSPTAICLREMDSDQPKSRLRKIFCNKITFLIVIVACLRAFHFSL
jgi:hypothetical protein